MSEKIDLKELVKKDLQTVKQKEFDLKKEKNSKLIESTIYINEGQPHAFVDKMFEYFDNVGIKYVTKDIKINPHSVTLVQMNTVPIIEVNNEYFVWQRDFQSFIQAEQILQSVATEDYVTPDINERIYQSLKNLTTNIKGSFTNLNRSLGPVIKVMSDLAKEEEAGKKTTNAKKNK